MPNANSILPGLPSGARILIVRLRSIGDIVLLTPTLRLLKQWRADLRVSVAVEPRFSDLLADSYGVDEVLEVGGRGQGAAARLREVSSLRSRGFALAVNLHGGPTSDVLTALAGARYRAGFHHFRHSWLYHFLVPDARGILNQPVLHTAELQTCALFWLGLPRAPIPRARLEVSPAAQAWWNRERASLGLEPGRDYALIHPAALYPSKRWSAEGFAALGEFLRHDAATLPLFCCGPGEDGVLDAVERAARHPLLQLRGTTLGQLAAALAGARIFIGNDSGPAHMAVALDRPAVVIFGSSSSPIWGPWRGTAGSGAPSRVVQNFYDCNPCPGDRCYRFARPECILSIRIDQVREAVEAVLAAPRAGVSPR